MTATLESGAIYGTIGTDRANDFSAATRTSHPIKATPENLRDLVIANGGTMPTHAAERAMGRKITAEDRRAAGVRKVLGDLVLPGAAMPWDFPAGNGGAPCAAGQPPAQPPRAPREAGGSPATREVCVRMSTSPSIPSAVSVPTTAPRPRAETQRVTTARPAACSSATQAEPSVSTAAPPLDVGVAGAAVSSPAPGATSRRAPPPAQSTIEQVAGDVNAHHPSRVEEVAERNGLSVVYTRIVLRAAARQHLIRRAGQRGPGAQTLLLWCGLPSLSPAPGTPHTGLSVGRAGPAIPQATNGVGDAPPRSDAPRSRASTPTPPPPPQKKQRPHRKRDNPADARENLTSTGAAKGAAARRAQGQPKRDAALAALYAAGATGLKSPEWAQLVPTTVDNLVSGIIQQLGRACVRRGYSSAIRYFHADFAPDELPEVTGYRGRIAKLEARVAALEALIGRTR